ncbi:hypothetical protein EUTSA_v10014672mg [Eutrema salsugineum]|uniref:Uncharacterized protein n=1 Tax=Eutrema salsugineum TaxID=72664 RepID=V4NA08_EUTSA|nr:uncharacterized protein LOC18016443 isoform X2 [Eutrema salsugineum]ESQ42621.1 hypothetical protein EUTSA_v10014672mg [Eutrema salsugineum]
MNRRINMEGAKRKISLFARKIVKRKNRRIVTSVVTYLKSDAYFFSPLFSDFPPLPPQIQMPPPSNSDSSKADEVSMAGFEALGIERVKKNKRKMSEKVKEYLKSDYHMYGPMISLPKLGSSLKGEVQIKNLVTMEVSTSTTTMREDNNSYRNLRSDIAEQTLRKGRISSPKRAMVILEGQRSRETDLSPAFSSLPEEKMVKPDQRRVLIE